MLFWTGAALPRWLSLTFPPSIPPVKVALQASHTPPPFPEPLSSASAVFPVIEDDPFIVMTPSDPIPPPERTLELPVTDDESFRVVCPVLPL
jgi:hypothetical protein